ncbi:unnamed protein product [Amoebophrya sp. A120]|nr:unnamed protein product [Amoebophrya sp. A120]|eukprot:GSA120T00017356001.1
MVLRIVVTSAAGPWGVLVNMFLTDVLLLQLGKSMKRFADRDRSKNGYDLPGLLEIRMGEFPRALATFAKAYLNSEAFAGTMQELLDKVKDLASNAIANSKDAALRAVGQAGAKLQALRANGINLSGPTDEEKKGADEGGGKDRLARARGSAAGAAAAFREKATGAVAAVKNADREALAQRAKGAASTALDLGAQAKEKLAKTVEQQKKKMSDPAYQKQCSDEAKAVLGKLASAAGSAKDLTAAAMTDFMKNMPPDAMLNQLSGERRAKLQKLLANDAETVDQEESKRNTPAGKEEDASRLQETKTFLGEKLGAIASKLRTALPSPADIVPTLVSTVESTIAQLQHSAMSGLGFMIVEAPGKALTQKIIGDLASFLAEVLGAFLRITFPMLPLATLVGTAAQPILAAGMETRTRERPREPCDRVKSSDEEMMAADPCLNLEGLINRHFRPITGMVVPNFLLQFVKAESAMLVENLQSVVLNAVEKLQTSAKVRAAAGLRPDLDVATWGIATTQSSWLWDSLAGIFSRVFTPEPPVTTFRQYEMVAGGKQAAEKDVGGISDQCSADVDSKAQLTFGEHAGRGLVSVLENTFAGMPGEVITDNLVRTAANLIATIVSFTAGPLTALIPGASLAVQNMAANQVHKSFADWVATKPGGLDIAHEVNYLFVSEFLPLLAKFLQVYWRDIFSAIKKNSPLASFTFGGGSVETAPPEDTATTPALSLATATEEPISEADREAVFGAEASKNLPSVEQIRDKQKDYDEAQSETPPHRWKGLLEKFAGQKMQTAFANLGTGFPKQKERQSPPRTSFLPVFWATKTGKRRSAEPSEKRQQACYRFSEIKRVISP